jgi:eukaryotic-like serine/threonine-protein kinase
MSLLESGSEVGKYTILGRLATGGMSEIYIARQSGLHGFSKVVVLKLILPHLAESPDLMNMFINEAKLAAVLNHPNVIQVFDYGEQQGRPYIVMEYIDGRNLNRIARALFDRRELVPLPISLRVISDTCGALAYAHELRDGSGTPLRIIHRDVSRENILLTYSGQVKLVDFGIAKATFLDSQTTEGTLKGKYAYMAPEIVRSEEPDHRIDIYALGVTLYALACGRLPYTAKHHLEILDQIMHKEPPAPRELNPSLPLEVEDIILRAMHKDKEQRYQRAADVQSDLEGYLMEHESSVMPYHLAKFMISVFPPGTDQDRETYQSLTTATPATTTGGRLARSSSIRHDETAGPEPIEPAPSRVVRRLGWWCVGLGLLLLAAGGGWKLYDRYLADRARPQLAARTPDARGSAADATPASRAARLAPDAAPSKPATVTPAKVAKVHRPRKPHLRPPTKPEAKTAPAGEGTLRILVDPWAKVTLDGKLLGITPLKPVKVSEGVHELLLENDELKVKQRRKVKVKAGQATEIRVSLD